MSDRPLKLTRRHVLKDTARACAAVAAPWIVPASILGRDGAVAPSEKIVLGGIGIGGRGQHVLGDMIDQPDVRFVAICDVRAERRDAIKKMADSKYNNTDCLQYQVFHDLLARTDID